ncbi:pentapeptide repeat-containing protein [Arthrospira sp. O9.13F]|nr:pentapeptide repeat-containing protein [Arthrospira sp. O9.13F]
MSQLATFKIPEYSVESKLGGGLTVVNQEQLTCLRRGVAFWNKWREDYPEVQPDMMNANLKGMYLKGINLRETNLTDTDLKGAYCLKGSCQNVEGDQAHFDGSYLKEADFTGAYLQGSSFKGADLRNVNFTNAHLVGVDFRGADIQGADFSGANLYRSQLMGVIASETKWCKANLLSANLLGTDLRSANLENANLTRANLEEVNLSNALAFHTNFEQATLTGVCIDQLKINNQTNFRRAVCDFVYLKADRQGRYPFPSNYQSLEEDAIALISRISSKLIPMRSSSSSPV